MNLNDRINRLMPNGLPRYIRVYDNDGRTLDRYTVVFTGNYNNIGKKRGETRNYSHISLAMSEHPFNPQGFCQHGETEEIIDMDKKSGWAPSIGRENHLGTRIQFRDLPEDCRKVVISDYKDLWNLNY